MAAAESQRTLTMRDGGRWRVTTSTTVYYFDLDSRSVECTDSHGKLWPLAGDRRLQLVLIDEIEVGSPMWWWMRRPEDALRGPEFWFIGPAVVSIVRASRAADSSFPGPALTEPSIRDRLSVEPQQLQRMVADGQVLQVTAGDGQLVYPAFQIADDGSLLPGLEAVLCELADAVGDDGWTCWRWLVGRPEYAGGRAVWELLRDGDVDVVVRAAGRAAWAWRQ